MPVLVKAEKIYDHGSGGEGKETTGSGIVSATPGPTCTVNPTASRAL